MDKNLADPKNLHLEPTLTFRGSFDTIAKANSLEAKMLSDDLGKFQSAPGISRSGHWFAIVHRRAFGPDCLELQIPIQIENYLNISYEILSEIGVAQNDILDVNVQYPNFRYPA